MPANSNFAFIVVQHLSPDYNSLMVELLSKKTEMPVNRAEDQANHSRAIILSGTGSDGTRGGRAIKESAFLSR